MSRCSQLGRAQDLLDGRLDAAEARAFERHASGCAECRLEIALYRQVFQMLDEAPTWDPGPAFTERVLDRVVPARARRERRLRLLGWGYAGAVAASLGALVGLVSQPLGRAVLAGLSGEASHRLFQTLHFVLSSLTWVAVRVAALGHWLDIVAGRIAPLARGIGAVVVEPAVALTLMAAGLASVAVILWMRPRDRAGSGEVRHVAILGF